VEDDAGERVHHGSEGGEGKERSARFDGALFGGALDFLEALGMRHRAYVPPVSLFFDEKCRIYEGAVARAWNCYREAVLSPDR